jgi:hypothetical protein
MGIGVLDNAGAPRPTFSREPELLGSSGVLSGPSLEKEILQAQSFQETVSWKVPELTWRAARAVAEPDEARGTARPQGHGPAVPAVGRRGRPSAHAPLPALSAAPLRGRRAAGGIRVE